MQKSLIKIEATKINGELIQTVNARELHKNLALKKKFSNWIRQQLDKKMFCEGVDYIILGDLKVTQTIGDNLKKEYFLTLDTAKHIAMMSRTKRGKELRQYFINVETNYKTMLKQQASQSWQAVRANTKVVRLQATDAIQELVEYATAQGSDSANKYYMAITKMENKALFYIAEALPKPNNIRDILNEMQLSCLATAEIIVAKTIRKGIADMLYYKEIYQLCKLEIEKFVCLIGKSNVPVQDSMLGHNSRNMIEGEGQDAVTPCPEPESLKNQPSVK